MNPKGRNISWAHQLWLSSGSRLWPRFQVRRTLIFKCWKWILKQKPTMMEISCSGSKDLASSSTLLSAPIRWNLVRGRDFFEISFEFTVFCGDGGRKSRVDQRDSENSGDSTSSPGEHQALWSHSSFFLLLRTTIWRCLWTRSGTTRLHFSTDDFNTKIEHCTGVYSPWNQKLTLSFAEFQ